LSCCWKHHHVLFLIVRHVLVMMDRIVANGHLFPFFFLSLFPWKLQFDPLCYLYFNSSPYSFDFEFFFLEPLIEVLFIFNFILPSQFAIYYFFSIWFLFFFRPLVELIFFSISLFNQIFFFIFYFIFILILLIVFFPLVQLMFLFNFTLQ